MRLNFIGSRFEDATPNYEYERENPIYVTHLKNIIEYNSITSICDNILQKHCPCDFELTIVDYMGLTWRYVGRTLYQKPTREQNETNTFVFLGYHTRSPAEYLI